MNGPDISSGSDTYSDYAAFGVALEIDYATLAIFALSALQPRSLLANPPAPVARKTKEAPAKAAADYVWVNTRSGKYWRPGSRFYGKTKQGEYMPELDALDRGYSPAGGTGQ